MLEAIFYLTTIVTEISRNTYRQYTSKTASLNSLNALTLKIINSLFYGLLRKFNRIKQMTMNLQQ